MGIRIRVVEYFCKCYALCWWWLHHYVCVPFVFYVLRTGERTSTRRARKLGRSGSLWTDFISLNIYTRSAQIRMDSCDL